MDYIFDLLTDTIDEELIDDPLVLSFPDKYRPHLFNIPMFKPSPDAETNASNTKTDIELWTCSYADLCKKVAVLEEKHDNIPEYYSLGDFVNDPTKFSTEINLFYRELYNLLDVCVCRLNSYRFVQLINVLIRGDQLKYQARICIYLNIYFIERTRAYGRFKKFADINKEKLLEFQGKYHNEHFGKGELDGYIKYLDKGIADNFATGSCGLDQLETPI